MATSPTLLKCQVLEVDATFGADLAAPFMPPNLATDMARQVQAKPNKGECLVFIRPDGNMSSRFCVAVLPIATAASIVMRGYFRNDDVTRRLRAHAMASRGRSVIVPVLCFARTPDGVSRIETSGVDRRFIGRAPPQPTTAKRRGSTLLAMEPF